MGSTRKGDQDLLLEWKSGSRGRDGSDRNASGDVRGREEGNQRREGFPDVQRHESMGITCSVRPMCS